MFFPMWSYVNENENKIVKNQKIKFLKNKQTNKQKWYEDILDRYLSSKFGVNPLDGFRENDVHGRTTDAYNLRHDSSSAVQ